MLQVWIQNFFSSIFQYWLDNYISITWTRQYFFFMQVTWTAGGFWLNSRTMRCSHKNSLFFWVGINALSRILISEKVTVGRTPVDNQWLKHLGGLVTMNSKECTLLKIWTCPKKNTKALINRAQQRLHEEANSSPFIILHSFKGIHFWAFLSAWYVSYTTTFSTDVWLNQTTHGKDWRDWDQGKTKTTLRSRPN